MCELFKELSQQLDKTLDKHGYKDADIKKRINMYDQVVDFFPKTSLSTKFPSYNYLIVGSRREGVAIRLDSDFDIISEEKTYVCAEDLKKINHIEKYDGIFTVDRTGAPPGYCYLTDESHAGETFTFSLRDEEFSDTVVTVAGPAYSPVRINDMKDAVKSFFINYTPSIIGRKVSSQLDKLTTDMVFAFPCVLPELLQDWCDRERKYDWPSHKSIYEVSKLKAHVVRTGLKGHENETNQWRISFTLAEVNLIQSLNNTHTKVYVCLKHIAKHHLKPKCDDITSYIVKNTVMWMAESQPMANFTPEQLVDRLQDAIRMLITSLQEKQLKNYMIPDRNLFFNKLVNDDEVSAVVDILKMFIKDMKATVDVIEQEMRSGNPIHRLIDHALLLSGWGMAKVQDISLKLFAISQALKSVVDSE